MDEYPIIYTSEQVIQRDQYLEERPVFDKAYDKLRKYKDYPKAREKWQNLLDITLRFGKQLQKRLVCVMEENPIRKFERERATLRQRLEELTEWRTDPDLEWIR